MKTTFIDNEKKDYLSVIIEGDWLEEDISPFLESVKNKAIEKNILKVFINALDLNLPLSDMIRFYTGEKIASTWGTFLKVAVLGKTEKINRFTENVAYNRGAFNFRVFDNLDEAILWLL